MREVPGPLVKVPLIHALAIVPREELLVDRLAVVLTVVAEQGTEAFEPGRIGLDEQLPVVVPDLVA